MGKRLDVNMVQHRWKELAGKQTINESREVLSTLVEVQVAKNGKTFGILKENAKYYIKEQKNNTKTTNAQDFDYIGGLQNKLMECYNTYTEAQRRLYGKIYSLNESVEILPEETEEELMDKLEDAKPEQAPAEEPVADVPVEEPVADVPTDVPTDVPAEVPVEEPAVEEPAAEAPVADAPAEAPIDVVGGEEQIPAEEPVADVPVEGGEEQIPAEEPVEGGEEGGEEIQSLLGKLGNLISQTPLSAQQTKNILNTIISSSKDGIEELDFEEKEELAKRIQKDGKKIEEDTIEGEETPAEELYEEEMPSTSFEEFCQQNGYSKDNDDDVVKALISYATKHDSGEIEADFDSIAAEINPYVFDKVSEMVSDDFKSELEGVLNPNQISLGNSQTNLFEGYEHLGKVIEKLVYTMVK